MKSNVRVGSGSSEEKKEGRKEKKERKSKSLRRNAFVIMTREIHFGKTNQFRRLRSLY
jgi:hypothetical protein